MATLKQTLGDVLSGDWMSLPPHRRDGDPAAPLMIYLAAISKLAQIRQSAYSKNAADEALVLDLLDRTWGKLSDDEKKAAKSALRQAYGNRWE
jgi:hypothetical protein